MLSPALAAIILGDDRSSLARFKATPDFWWPANDLGAGAVDLTLRSGSGSGTFARTTIATTFDVNGNIVQVGTGVARSYYDPVSHVYLGYLAEEARTQFLGVTDTPATQTTSSLATGTYVLWVVGSGSATPSAGTATITGAAAASAGSPNIFTVTVAGTVTVTVSGSLTRFQLEKGAFATTYIPNAGAAGSTVTRNADVLTFPIGNVDATVGTAYLEFAGGAQGTQGNVLSLSPGGGGVPLFLQTSNALGFYDGSAVRSLGSLPSRPAATAMKLATRWAAGTSACAGTINGGAITTGAFDGDLNAGANISVGANNDGASAGNGAIRNLKLYKRAATDAQLIALTS